MLTSYKGPSNSIEVLQYLLGETITAAFQDDVGAIVLVLGSGDAIVFGTRGGGSPVYWPEREPDVQARIARRREEIQRKLAELRNLPGVDLP